MKLTPFLLIPLLFLSSCSIDWNDAKDAKIAELEKQVQDIPFQKKIECGKLKNEMEKSMPEYLKKDSIGQDLATDIKIWKIRLYLRDVFYSSKGDSCIFSFNKAEDKLTESWEWYIEVKYYIVDYLNHNLLYETEDSCNQNSTCEGDFNKELQEVK